MTLLSVLFGFLSGLSFGAALTAKEMGEVRDFQVFVFLAALFLSLGVGLSILLRPVNPTQEIHGIPLAEPPDSATCLGSGETLRSSRTAIWCQRKDGTRKFTIFLR